MNQEPSKKTKQDWREELDRVYAEFAKAEKEEDEYNTKLLKDNNIPLADFESLLGLGSVNGKLDITSEPIGNDQNKNWGVFTQVFVDELTNCMSEEPYKVFIYAKFTDKLFLKIPYSC